MLLYCHRTCCGYQYFYILGLGLALTVAWVSHRRLKKCPAGKVGFLVAIAVDDDDTYKIFQRDFTQNIERLLLESGIKERVWVSELPQWRLDRQFNHDEAASLREAAGCTFVLYGQVRTRKADRRKHYIDLFGLVGHAATEEHNTNRLRGEFIELLPRRIIAEEGSELPTFELNSALSSLVAKYIVGIAAYLSGALDAAEVLYKDARRLALPLASSHEVSQKILQRLPIRHSEIVITRARGAYQKWCGTRRDADLVEMGGILSTAPEEAHQLTEWRTLQAISLVATAGADLDQIEALVKSDPDGDPVKHLNLAFFDMARGDLRAASRHYRNAEQREVKLESLTEVISFLDWFKDFRPELRCEVGFALGFILVLHGLPGKAALIFRKK